MTPDQRADAARKAVKTRAIRRQMKRLIASPEFQAMTLAERQRVLVSLQKVMTQ